MNDDRPALIRNAWIVFLLLFISAAYFYQSGEHNENARFDQLRALIEDGHVAINTYAYNTADTIVVNDQIFPNKPPGLTYLAAPAWWAISGALSEFPLSPALYDHLRCYLTEVVTIGALSAALGVAVYFVIANVAGVRAGTFLALAYGLGTIAFPFSTLFFSHQATSAALFLPFAIVFFWRAGQITTCRAATLFFCGASCGFSVLCDYPGVLGAIIVSLYAGWKIRSVPAGALWIAGGLSAGALLIAYNLAAFGEPFFVTYGAYTHGDAAQFPGHRLGLFGARLPDLDTLYRITFHPQRGLFVCNPWLVLVIPALVVPFCRRGYLAEKLTSAAMVIAFFAFNAGYGDSLVYWGGAASIGPRHLIPMLPFAALLISFLAEFVVVRGALALLVPASIFCMLIATAVEPRLPYEYGNPLKEFLWENYRAGRFALLDNGVFGNERTTVDSVAFNLGKLAGLPGAAQLVPLGLTWFVGWIALFAPSRRTERGFGVFGGASILAAASSLVMGAAPLFLVPRDADPAGMRNGVYGSYYSRLLWSPDVFRPEFLNMSDDERRAARKSFVYSAPAQSLQFQWNPGHPRMKGSFSAVYDACLDIRESGFYSFHMESDDGAALEIDHTIVVTAWGTHGAVPTAGGIVLSPGMHQLRLLYFNSMFGGSLEVSMGREGEAPQILGGDLVRLHRDDGTPCYESLR